MPNQLSLISHRRSETLGATAGTSRGTTVTAGGTANVKGSWIDVGGTTSFAYEDFNAILARGNSSAVEFLVDIGINVGGNRFVIAEDLKMITRNVGDIGYAWPCPVHVPAGAQLSARCQASVTSQLIDIVIVGNSAGLMGLPGASQMRRLSDLTASSSRGVNIDTGTTAHTKVRTDITASTPVKANGIIIAIGPGGDVARTPAGDFLFDLEMGAAASEQVLLSNMPLSYGTTLDVPEPRWMGWFAVEIPASIKMSINAQASVTGAGDRIFDAIVYGLVR